MDSQGGGGGARGFCSSRPPMVVFLLCLASFGLTTFSLSVYVAQTDNVRNPDVLDWSTLLSRLAKLDFCLPANVSTYNVTTSTLSSASSTSLSVPVSSSFAAAFYKAAREFSKKSDAPIQVPVRAEGFFEVKYLGRGLPADLLGSNLTLAFELPPPIDATVTRSVSDDVDIPVCLEVRGPKNLLRFLEVNDTCSSNSRGVGGVQFAHLPMMVHSPDHKPVSWCERHADDIQMNLAFDAGDYKPEWTMYVTAKDKELIHLHLMVTSVFLFAILAAVIIAYIVRNVTSKRKQIPNDNRGDHHLIMMTQLDRDA